MARKAHETKVVHAFTITPLAAAGTFTSAWQQVPLQPLILTATTKPVYHDKMYLVGYVLADQASAAAGLIMQGSMDGVNVTFFTPNAAVLANNPTSFGFLIVTKFVRLFYTNGAVAQTAFVLAAWLEGEI